jgi:hypothetical protein
MVTPARSRRRIMTYWIAWRAVTVVLLVVASAACATTQEAAKPGVVAVDVVEFTSSVEAVDYQKRTVVLKGPDGRLRTFTASKDVRNLAQVKPGDLVKDELVEEVALFVRKEATETSSVGVAPKGKKPGIILVDTVQVTAEVEAVDYQKRTTWKRERDHLAARGHRGSLPPATFLALSGGGDDGAVGAGLLAGWTAAGNRPEFKLVTGISTGALIAPFAFLEEVQGKQLGPVRGTICR